jgi:hypothetical protein
MKYIVEPKTDFKEGDCEKCYRCPGFCNPLHDKAKKYKDINEKVSDEVTVKSQSQKPEMKNEQTISKLLSDR